MAVLSGWFSNYDWYRFNVDIRERNVDVANNRSEVYIHSMSLTKHDSTGRYSGYTGNKVSVSFGGKTFTTTTNSYDFRGGVVTQNIPVPSGWSVTVPHNDDGSLNLSVVASFICAYGKANTAQNVLGTARISGNFPLTKINRYPVLTSASSPCVISKGLVWTWHYRTTAFNYGLEIWDGSTHILSLDRTGSSSSRTETVTFTAAQKARLYRYLKGYSNTVYNVRLVTYTKAGAYVYYNSKNVTFMPDDFSISAPNTYDLGSTTVVGASARTNTDTTFEGGAVSSSSWLPGNPLSAANPYKDITLPKTAAYCEAVLGINQSTREIVHQIYMREYNSRGIETQFRSKAITAIVPKIKLTEKSRVLGVTECTFKFNTVGVLTELTHIARESGANITMTHDSTDTVTFKGLTANTQYRVTLKVRQKGSSYEHLDAITLDFKTLTKPTPSISALTDPWYPSGTYRYTQDVYPTSNTARLDFYTAGGLFITSVNVTGGATFTLNPALFKGKLASRVRVFSNMPTEVELNTLPFPMKWYTQPSAVFDALEYTMQSEMFITIKKELASLRCSMKIRITDLSLDFYSNTNLPEGRTTISDLASRVPSWDANGVRQLRATTEFITSDGYIVETIVTDMVISQFGKMYVRQAGSWLPVIPHTARPTGGVNTTNNGSVDGAYNALIPVKIPVYFGMNWDTVYGETHGTYHQLTAVSPNLYDPGNARYGDSGGNYLGTFVDRPGKTMEPIVLPSNKVDLGVNVTVGTPLGSSAGGGALYFYDETFNLVHTEYLPGYISGSSGPRFAGSTIMFDSSYPMVTMAKYMGGFFPHSSQLAIISVRLVHRMPGSVTPPQHEDTRLTFIENVANFNRLDKWSNDDEFVYNLSTPLDYHTTFAGDLGLGHFSKTDRLYGSVRVGSFGFKSKLFKKKGTGGSAEISYRPLMSSLAGASYTTVIGVMRSSETDIAMDNVYLRLPNGEEVKMTYHGEVSDTGVNYYHCDFIGAASHSTAGNLYFVNRTSADLVFNSVNTYRVMPGTSPKIPTTPYPNLLDRYSGLVPPINRFRTKYGLSPNIEVPKKRAFNTNFTRTFTKPVGVPDLHTLRFNFEVINTTILETVAKLKVRILLNFTDKTSFTIYNPLYLKPTNLRIETDKFCTAEIKAATHLTSSSLQGKCIESYSVLFLGDSTTEDIGMIRVKDEILTVKEYGMQAVQAYVYRDGTWRPI